MGNESTLVYSLIQPQRQAVIFVRGHGGRLFIFGHSFLRRGINVSENQYETFTPPPGGPALPEFLDLDLETGFDKTAPPVAGTASRCEGATSVFRFPKKVWAILLFPFLFSTLRFVDSLFGGRARGTR